MKANGPTVRSEGPQKQGSSLESNDYVTFARDRICLFAVDGEVGVVPKDVGLRGHP
jgi:hypothetical protein